MSVTFWTLGFGYEGHGNRHGWYGRNFVEDVGDGDPDNNYDKEILRN